MEQTVSAVVEAPHNGKKNKTQKQQKKQTKGSYSLSHPLIVELHRHRLED